MPGFPGLPRSAPGDRVSLRIGICRESGMNGHETSTAARCLSFIVFIRFVGYVLGKKLVELGDVGAILQRRAGAEPGFEDKKEERFLTADQAAVIRQGSFSYEDLIQCAKGNLFGPGNAQLPMPPMLMIDRIIEISEDGGINGKGGLVAEYDITPERWFFDCHFEGDPVMPGCLGLDAMWQLVGFFLGWLGGEGKGRALGVGEVKFFEMVLPTAKRITYEINLKRVIMRRLIMGIADGVVKVDGTPATEAKDMKVGLFKADAP